jgi:hypothetical protein
MIGHQIQFIDLRMNGLKGIHWIKQRDFSAMAIKCSYHHGMLHGLYSVQCNSFNTEYRHTIRKIWKELSNGRCFQMQGNG